MPMMTMTNAKIDAQGVLWAPVQQLMQQLQHPASGFFSITSKIHQFFRTKIAKINYKKAAFRSSKFQMKIVLMNFLELV